MCMLQNSFAYFSPSPNAYKVYNDSNGWLKIELLFPKPYQVELIIKHAQFTRMASGSFRCMYISNIFMIRSIINKQISMEFF